MKTITVVTISILCLSFAIAATAAGNMIYKAAWFGTEPPMGLVAPGVFFGLLTLIFAWQLLGKLGDDKDCVRKSKQSAEAAEMAAESATRAAEGANKAAVETLKAELPRAIANALGRDLSPAVWEALQKALPTVVAALKGAIPAEPASEGTATS